MTNTQARAGALSATLCGETWVGPGAGQIKPVVSLRGPATWLTCTCCLAAIPGNGSVGSGKPHGLVEASSFALQRRCHHSGLGCVAVAPTSAEHCVRYLALLILRTTHWVNATIMATLQMGTEVQGDSGNVFFVGTGSC